RVIFDTVVPSRSVSRRPRLDGRIVGGYVIDITDAPYMVSLRKQGHACGGSIIKIFLCLSGVHRTAVRIRAGSTTHAKNGTLCHVARIILHPSYSPFTFDYDYSLMELETSLTFNNATQPIGLPKQDQQFPDGTPCMISGWGRTQNSDESNGRLRAAVIPTVNQMMCSLAYIANGGVTDRMVCAGFLHGGTSPCDGDSGGNVVSWGYGCAYPLFPVVFSRVAAVRSWIDSNTGI
ncbi:Trypsin-1, partial [Pseudolycoriella hygida]